MCAGRTETLRGIVAQKFDRVQVERPPPDCSEHPNGFLALRQTKFNSDLGADRQIGSRKEINSTLADVDAEPLDGRSSIVQENRHGNPQAGRFSPDLVSREEHAPTP